MSTKKGQDDEISAYKASLSREFFSDESTTDARRQEERRRGRTAKERAHFKKRTKERTVHIGIRTTPAVRALIQSLATRLNLKTSTEVIERALFDLDQNSNQSTDQGKKKRG